MLTLALANINSGGVGSWTPYCFACWEAFLSPEKPSAQLPLSLITRSFALMDAKAPISILPFSGYLIWMQRMIYSRRSRVFFDAALLRRAKSAA